MFNKPLAVAAILSVAPFSALADDAQLRTNCDSQSCTISVDLNTADPYWPVAGAPYSGQLTFDVARTLPDGTHTSAQSDQPMTYRDSRGRMRIEHPAVQFSPLMQRQVRTLPDASIIVEIQDPVANCWYFLDPVNLVAHRTQFRTPMTVTTYSGEPAGARFGGSSMESLGTKDIAGVTASGMRSTNTGRGGADSTEERWTDPANGVMLVRVNTSARNTETQTMTRYSKAEPEPALFVVPPNYKIVEEAGPYRIVHPTANPNAGMSSGSTSTRCSAESCILTFNYPTGRTAGAVSGAPYSGQRVNANNGSPGIVTYRDSKGRLRTEQPVGVGDATVVVEIQDAVGGYRYVLDPANRVAHRITIQAQAFAYRPTKNLPTGLRTAPDGKTTNDEDLGTRTISGVTAVGHRITSVSPPGTQMNNDAPITLINESWTDPATGADLSRKSSGSNGDFAMAMRNYSTAEPNPSLFQVPEGYKVVDEPGSFTVVIARVK